MKLLSTGEGEPGATGIWHPCLGSKRNKSVINDSISGQGCTRGSVEFRVFLTNKPGPGEERSSALPLKDDTAAPRKEVALKEMCVKLKHVLQQHLNHSGEELFHQAVHYSKRRSAPLAFVEGRKLEDREKRSTSADSLLSPVALRVLRTLCPAIHHHHGSVHPRRHEPSHFRKQMEQLKMFFVPGALQYNGEA
ncbi:hypothetical protein MHYP_G00242440 [Metynnis hypsauchen]